MGEFSRSPFPHKSIELFVQMWEESGTRPDDFTLPLVLRACAGSREVEFGVLLHGLCVKLGLEMSLFVASALVSFYVSVFRVFDAQVLFDEMPRKDSVLWTSMFAGYAQVGEPLLGLEVYRKMVGSGVEVDGVVMISLLLVCGQLGWLKHGKSVHGWCVRRILVSGLNLGNAVVDMYVKCGKLSYGHCVFDRMLERDVISWSSLILGYGLGGNVSLALDLFDWMLKEGIKPNDVTFLGVLTACAHGGLVERARECFNMMQEYQVVAELKHYATLVDCLARAGLLEEAEGFIDAMPIEPDAAVLAAIVAGCRVHNNFEVGERIAKKLIEVEPSKAGYYVLLSNIYAEMGRYDEAEKVRIFMKEKNVTKEPGFSLIESKSMPSHNLPRQNHPPEIHK